MADALMNLEKELDKGTGKNAAIVGFTVGALSSYVVNDLAEWQNIGTQQAFILPGTTTVFDYVDAGELGLGLLMVGLGVMGKSKHKGLLATGAGVLAGVAYTKTGLPRPLLNYLKPTP